MLLQHIHKDFPKFPGLEETKCPASDSDRGPLHWTGQKPCWCLSTTEQNEMSAAGRTNVFLNNVVLSSWVANVLEYFIQVVTERYAYKTCVHAAVM